jgi:hypothetical protein
MKACIVENDVVVNIIEVEENANLADFNAVDLGQLAEIGDAVVNGVIPEVAEREAEVAANEVARVRGEAIQARNELLAETDWWVLSDTPSATQEQLDYRQALRDLPDQEGFPNVDFPVKPD